MSVPPASLESTTVYVPAGAGSAPTLSTARRAASVAAFRDATRRAAGEGDEVVDIGHVRIRVGRSLAAGHADAGTLIDPADRVLDVVVVEDELQGLVPLPEKLGPVAAA